MSDQQHFTRPAPPAGRYRTANLPHGPSGTWARTCTDCGALVLDRAAHDRHHDVPASEPASAGPLPDVGPVRRDERGQLWIGQQMWDDSAAASTAALAEAVLAERQAAVDRVASFIGRQRADTDPAYLRGLDAAVLLVEHQDWQGRAIPTQATADTTTSEVEGVAFEQAVANAGLDPSDGRAFWTFIAAYARAEEARP